MKAGEIDAWLGHQGGEPGDEVQGFENDIGCSVKSVALAQGGQLEVKDLPSTLIEYSVHVVREEACRLPTLVEREADYNRQLLES